MLFAELAAASEAVAAASARSAKTTAIADVLRRLSPDEVPVAVGILTGQPRQGRIGVGWSTLSKLGAVPADEATLEILEIDRWLDTLAGTAGAGSVATRQQLLRDVFDRATAAEQRLLWGLFSGELRQGALEGVMLDAVAKGSGVPAAAVRRANMLSGDLGATARAAFAGGATALEAVTLQPGRAVEPMLASPAADVVDALANTGLASVEWKLDGARVQAHRRDGAIRLFTRNLNDITDRLPAVVDLVAGLPGGDLVLDGEVAGLAEDGSPRRFQDTMSDFGADAVSGRGGTLGAYFFDVMHAQGTPLVDEPLSTRRAVLVTTVPEQFRLPSIVTADADEAAAFMDDAVRRGQEGVMVKAIESTYAAGRRGGSWRKVKPVYTFDLVVLAVEWGHGRRRGWLSNLHLGARDPSSGSFVMVGKTFKGMTDELLAWQTDTFTKMAIGGTDGHVVHVRPELVVEIAIDGVQRSTRYPGGVALRFARVKRYRPDKRPAEADTIERLQSML
ncbi:ATP-dependent DNA ligase [Desertimonas flava]|uniref:ATP-dependent DNA ligase n=1 Tax=Desertimonas flava TaxID=2064846 RepID=UPI000E352334|nr:ATP-dependent DNA ligase [Desertimonas flava]